MKRIKHYHCHLPGVMVLIFMVHSLFAQGGIPLSVDMAQFRDAKNNPYLEIYYAVPDNAIHYIKNDRGLYVSKAVMDLMIYKGDSLWANKVWKVEKTRQDSLELEKSRQMIDMFRYFLDEPTTYRVVMHIRDLTQENRIDSIETEIHCRMFSDKSLELSDVQLASKIQKASPGSSNVFNKRNYEVIPNPTLIFGENAPVLYYYFEVYNVMKNVPGNIYKCMAFLKDASGKVVEGLGSPSRTKRKRYDNTVEMGIINVSKLPSGQYYFVYGVSDSSGNLIKTREKKIFIYNPSIAGTTLAKRTGVIKSGSFGELDTMNEEALDQEFKYMRYITSKEDRNFYKNLTNLQAKREFIYSLWNSYQNAEGVDPMTFRKIYLGRIQEANNRYQESGKKGWETDRGRVFVLYGAPTNIERFPNSPQNKPYQIWTYDYLRGQGGVVFIFADRFGFNKYELLHSTLRGELQDPFWRRYILVGPQQQIESGIIRR
ncbi:MAG: GWxTD domain-containing protein [Calditrichaeota bacterium]|nr:MAG: GWxTD domain-containing protein [Calditrichota bacterium]